MSVVMTNKLPRIIVWPLLWLVSLSPLLVWSITVPDAWRYFRMEGLPPGQPLYVAAKLMGLFAICLFWLQCVLALARSAPLLSGFPNSGQRLHRRLGLATLTLILLHVGLFVVAASLRTGHVAWDLLLPSVGHGYYRTSVGFGAAAFWICLLAVYAGFRVASGHRKLKFVHMLWPIVFALALVHAINIGTESRYGAMRYVIVFIAVTLSIAAASRLRRKIRMSAELK